MSNQTFNELIKAIAASGTQISNSVTETIMVPDTPLPADYWYQKRTLRAKLIGKLSNVVTTPGSLTLRARLGGVAGTLLAASAALNLNVAAQTDSQVEIDFLMTCRNVGLSATSGSMWTSGSASLGNSRSTQGLRDLIPASGNAVVSSLDLTSASILSFTAQFSVATSPTNLIIDQFLIESLN